MAGLQVALNNALSSLNVNQQQLAVLSQNIANANTAGYSRQVANQQAVYLDGQGDGVSIEEVTRQVDQYLTQAVQGQNTVVSQTGVVSNYNTNIQQLLGQPGSNNSLDGYVSAFFNNMQALVQTPGNTALQQSVVNSGVTLATQVQSLAQGLQGLQLQADQDIGGAVSSINSDLQQLAQVNSSLTANASLGKSLAALEDQRDALLKDMSQYLPVQTFIKQDGSVNVTTQGGVTLLDQVPYQLSYSPATTVDTITNGNTLSALTVTQINSSGVALGQPIQLVSAAPAGQAVTSLTSGKIAGLLQMRDQQIPALLGQLDAFAGSLRTQVNAVQNAGTGFPGVSSYTGDRAVNAGDFSQWGGSVRIAVLGGGGQPVQSPYADEPNGMQPLTLDLSSLNTGQGQGNPTMQGIVDAINNYYGTPQNKAEVGNINNVQMVSNSASLPGTPPQFSFGFNLNNISANPSNVFVTGVQVTDSTGNAAATQFSTPPAVALASANTYLTTADSKTVTINTAGTNNNLVNGQEIYLSDPGIDIAGIPESAMTGYFTVSNVTATSFQITASAAAASSTATSVSGQTALLPYATVPPGQTALSTGSAPIIMSLSSASSPYYDITATVTVDDGQSGPQTAQVTYRINNQQSGLLGSRYGATAVTGSGRLVLPSATRPLAAAILVDANGNELPKVNGKYTTLQNGYLQIKTLDGGVIALGSLDSVQQGQPNNNPPIPGTNLGFSSYFGLNDFFVPNQLTTTGDTVAKSALNLQVSQALQSEPARLALGKLTPSPQSANPAAPPNYTYETTAGDNSVISQMAGLGLASVNFAAAGGLAATRQNFGSYVTQMIGNASQNAADAKTADTNAQTLMDGYTQRASAVSGVNLDTELANTVIYQNAYTASARIITVVNSLFDALLQSVG